MTDNIKKSINSTLYQRTTSPFYGTVILSWIIWNWRIIYLTFFISEDKIETDKISYIIEHFSETENLIINPLISTLILLTLIPFVSNGAFWLNLNFEKWKKDKKNIVEKKQLLSLEQSISIREELLNQENKFEKLLNKKNTEVEQLKLLIDKLKSENPSQNIIDLGSGKQEMDFDFVANKIREIDKDLVSFERALELMQAEYEITDRSDVDSKLVTFMVINDVIEKNIKGIYVLTKNGKELAKRLLS